jgi:hypothetical protein
MPCSRQTAVLRLITLWAIRSEADADFSIRIQLDDIIADNIVAIVMAGDLFADLDHHGEEPPNPEAQRRRDLLQAWLHTRPGRIQ